MLLRDRITKKDLKHLIDQHIEARDQALKLGFDSLVKDYDKIISNNKKTLEALKHVKK